MTTTDGNYKFSTSILFRVTFFSDVLYLIKLMFRVFPLSAPEIPTTDGKCGFFFCSFSASEVTTTDGKCRFHVTFI